MSLFYTVMVVVRLLKKAAVVDRHANIISPFTIAPANNHEGPLFTNALQNVKRIFKQISLEIQGITMSLDSAYDSNQKSQDDF